MAECPLLLEKEARKFFPNVVLLGTNSNYFFVMPLKSDMLSGKMRLGLPFATQKIFSRKNRHMPQVKVGEVSFEIPDSIRERMSVDEYEKCVKFQRVFSSFVMAQLEGLYKKCEIVNH